MRQKVQNFTNHIIIFIIGWLFIYIGGKAIFGISFFQALAITLILILIYILYKAMGRLGKPGF